MNRTNREIKLENGDSISVISTEFLIIVSLSDSIETLFTFDSKDVEGLRYLHNHPVEYLVEQFSTDSNIDEVLDSCESIKDDLKQLYRETPELIKYNKETPYSYEESHQDQSTVVEQVASSDQKRDRFIRWTRIPGWVILIAILAIPILIGLRHNILCSLQGGEIRAYEPTYQVTETGQTFKGNSLEHACVKETSTGLKTLFDIK